MEETIARGDEAVIRGREAAWRPVPSHGKRVLGQGEIWPVQGGISVGSIRAPRGMVSVYSLTRRRER